VSCTLGRLRSCRHVDLTAGQRRPATHGKRRRQDRSGGVLGSNVKADEIIQAGTVVGDKIPAGTVTADKVAANAITNKTVDVGRGLINVDPYLMDQTAWGWESHAGTFQDVSAAPAGSRTARNLTLNFPFCTTIGITPSIHKQPLQVWARSVGPLRGDCISPSAVRIMRERWYNGGGLRMTEASFQQAPGRSSRLIGALAQTLPRRTTCR
jgi:hypothetical protein